MARSIICPNARCNYVGEGGKRPKGSCAVGCLLLLIFFPIGLIYLALKSGSYLECPQCGVQVGSA